MARSIAERLAATRGARPARTAPPPGRAAALASWFGAELSTADGGHVVIVERSTDLPPEAAARLATRPAAAYLDTETTGLSTGAGTVVFLAAIGHLDGERLRIRQYLLPDYPHERTLLRLVAGELARTERLVSYNGRAFDLPLLVARLTINGLFGELAALPAPHDDLLPIARRLWRRPLGGARLAQIEAGVLGVQRAADCPSSEVPGRWFSYLRGGSAALLAAVLDHNFQDVASLALLEAEVLRLRDGGWRDAAPLDRRGMALELLRWGAHGEALAALDLALATLIDPEQAAAARRLATRLLINAGEIDRAEALWHPATRRASVEAAMAWVQIARIRERHRGELAGALQAATAASRVLDLAFALGRGGSIADLGTARLVVDRRLRRLRRWVAAAERRAALSRHGGRSREASRHVA